MSRELDVFTSSVALSEEDVRGKTVVVVDVLRASSTIITALANGAKNLIPVLDMGEASKISQNLDTSRCMLCGEKDGKMIDGYDLGNSPFEYTPEVVEGKTLIYTTTNGTKAVSRSSSASRLLIAGFLNVDAVVDKLREDETEIIIVCAGWKGRLSLEDVLCAGYLVHGYYGGVLPEDAKDGAKVAMGVFERFQDQIIPTILGTNHAKRLYEMGFGDDIEYCCRLNSHTIVPQLEEGVFRI
jgi:2-phosphosulfolactate phosphatase